MSCECNACRPLLKMAVPCPLGLGGLAHKMPPVSVPRHGVPQVGVSPDTGVGWWAGCGFLQSRSSSEALGEGGTEGGWSQREERNGELQIEYI